MPSNEEYVNKEHPQDVCWVIFVVHNFSGLFSDEDIFSSSDSALT